MYRQRIEVSRIVYAGFAVHYYFDFAPTQQLVALR
jgi:hypothetical protein